MSHELDMTTGQAAVFVAGTPAWHKLGRVVTHAVTSAQAIELACLNWEVEQWELKAFDRELSKEALVRNKYANVRKDTSTVLGVVSDHYRIFQNQECFDFMDALVADKLAMFETAGALKDGRVVWMLARIPTEYRAGTDDAIQPYILLTNSHDGSKALRIFPTTIRVVCQNTLNLALRDGLGDGISIRHRPSLSERVGEARQKLGIIHARFDEFDAELHAMLDKQMTDPELEGYFKGSTPPITGRRAEERRRKILGQFRENFGNATNTLPGVTGTAWAAYNAVSQYFDHQRNFKGANSLEKADHQLESIWFGSSHHAKQEAYQKALTLARN
jgi:phage/plasmid-like protein (TIGR03299 family)